MDHRERKLHYWLRNQIASLRNGLLLPERVATLDQRVPGWSASHRRHFGWDEMLARAVAFHAETGRLPSLSSADSNEQTLEDWLRRQAATRTAARDRWHTERVAILDSFLPGWRLRTRTGDQKRWESQLEQIVEHVQTHGRLPVMGPASSPGEFALCKWIAAQRHAQKKGKLYPERAARLDEVIPNWRHGQGAGQSKTKPATTSDPAHGTSP